MDLITIYSSLQTLPKDVLEIVWSKLRPDAQRKLSMTCVRFNDLFHMDKNLKLVKVPDLNSLVAESIGKKLKHTKEHYDEKISRWQIWINESTQINDKLFCWRWQCDHVRLEIIFLKIDHGYLITGIRAQYRTPEDRDYSFSEFDIRPHKKMSRYHSNNNVHGPKFTKLHQDSIVYQQLSRIIKNWISNDRVRYLLNPVCADTVYHRDLKSLKFRVNESLFFGLKCFN